MPEPKRRCPECREPMMIAYDELNRRLWVCYGLGPGRCGYSEPVAQDVLAMLDPNQGRMEV